MDRMKLVLQKIITGIDSTGAYVYTTAWVHVPRVIAVETEAWLCEILEQDGEKNEIKLGFALPDASVIVNMRVGPFVYSLVSENNKIHTKHEYQGPPVVLTFPWEGHQYQLAVPMDQIKTPSNSHMSIEEVTETSLRAKTFTYVTFGIYKK